MLAQSEIPIVGGGPIGLAYAWGIKKINKALSVVVLEKYSEYQRKHTLVMQPENLAELMKETGAEDDPDLKDLLAKLKKDPHIKTNELEGIFKKVAIREGVQIRIEEVKEKTFWEQVTPKGSDFAMLMGVDGTHSITDKCAFPAGNQIKHEFDFVLQFRFEIAGEVKSSPINTVSFYQDMARHGMIANEYVGNYSNGVTPVTMQMMISKAHFNQLKNATSKRPMKPFADVEDIQQDVSENEIKAMEFRDCPPELQKFLLSYLRHRMESCHAQHQKIDRSSLRISVNEAPATHAQQVFIMHGQTPCVLGGDASLGLSYFKGLNAGLKAAAKFFRLMRSQLELGLKDKHAMKSALTTYQDWFLNDFAPAKVKEVGLYSTLQIRSLMKTMKVVHSIKETSMPDTHIDVPDSVYEAYFKYMQKDHLSELGDNKKLRLYPHRSYDPVKLGQFAPVPIIHSLKKIGKIFVDFGKPYKSSSQFVQDLKQPLVSLVNLFSGVVKIISGIFTLKGKRIGDGFFTLGRGLVELITSPLSYTLKPLSRGLLTLIKRPKIEENAGMKRLAHYGHTYLDRINPADAQVEGANTSQHSYNLLAICGDLHRKYEKAVEHKQNTQIEQLEEFTKYQIIHSDTKVNNEALRRYFSLFAEPAPKKNNENESLLPKYDLGVGH